MNKSFYVCWLLVKALCHYKNKTKQNKTKKYALTAIVSRKKRQYSAFQSSYLVRTNLGS